MKLHWTHLQSFSKHFVACVHVVHVGSCSFSPFLWPSLIPRQQKHMRWNMADHVLEDGLVENTSQRNLEEAYSLIIAIDQTLITLFMQRLLEDILIWVLRIWKITGRSRNWKSLHFEQQPNQLHGRHLYLSYLSSKVEMARTAGWELKAIICMWNVQKRSHPSERKQMLRHRDLQRLRWQEQQDGNWKSSTDSSTLFPFSTCIIIPWVAVQIFQGKRFVLLEPQVCVLSTLVGSMNLNLDLNLRFNFGSLLLYLLHHMERCLNLNWKVKVSFE